MTPENFVAWISGYYELTDELTNMEEIIYNYMIELKPLDFCYFLNGYFELTDEKFNTKEKIIKEHLQLVLNKVTTNKSELGSPDTYKDSLNQFNFKNVAIC